MASFHAELEICILSTLPVDSVCSFIRAYMRRYVYLECHVKWGDRRPRNRRALGTNPRWGRILCGDLLNFPGWQSVEIGEWFVDRDVPSDDPVALSRSGPGPALAQAHYSRGRNVKWHHRRPIVAFFSPQIGYLRYHTKYYNCK